MLKTVSSITNALGAVNYAGTWNASTNSPALSSGAGTKGDYYVVGVAGSTTLDGISNWGVGDWAVFNGSVWQRVEGGTGGNFIDLSATGTVSGAGFTNYLASPPAIGGTAQSAVTGTVLTAKNATSGTYAVLENTDPSIGGGEAIAFNMVYTEAATSTGWQWLSRYAGANLQLHRNTNNAGFTPQLIIYTAGFTPGSNNAVSLGDATNRWSQVYAVNGTINTSDGRMKQDVEVLDEAEKRTAIAIKGLLRKFRFKDAVAAKGDTARLHIGAVAQDVAQAFRNNGLDPEHYGIFCYDEWGDKFENIVIEEQYTDENGKQQTRFVKTDQMRQTQWAGNSYGLRYEQLLAFVIAAI